VKEPIQKYGSKQLAATKLRGFPPGPSGIFKLVFVMFVLVNENIENRLLVSFFSHLNREKVRGQLLESSTDFANLWSLNPA